jgi:hypothetical protein
MSSPEVFGEICSWNGYELQYAEDVSNINETKEAEGINLKTKTIIARVSDFQELPEATDKIIFNDEFWYVLDVKKKFVLLFVTLERRD